MPEDDHTSPDEAKADVPMFGVEAEEEWNRPRGIYTGTDRKFLWGVKEYTDRPVSRSNRRGEIRERTINSLRDLLYLSLIDDERRERIFDEVNETTDPGELRDAVASLIEFLYLGLDDREKWLTETVTDGVANALHAETSPGTYGFPSVDVDIDTEKGYNLDELEERLRDGYAHTLTAAEVGALVKMGRVDREDLEELAQNEPLARFGRWADERDDS